MLVRLASLLPESVRTLNTFPGESEGVRRNNRVRLVDQGDDHESTNRQSTRDRSSPSKTGSETRHDTGGNARTSQPIRHSVCSLPLRAIFPIGGSSYSDRLDGPSVAEDSLRSRRRVHLITMKRTSEVSG